MTKIAVIQTAFPGDVILSTPLYQALKDLEPSSYVAAVVRPESVCILKNNPYINEVIPFDKYGDDKGSGGITKMAAKLKGYDQAILVQRHTRSALIARLARIPDRVGYNISAAHLLYTTKVLYRENVHEVQRCLDLIGVNNDNGWYKPKIFLDENTVANAKLILKNNNIYGNFIVIAPGSVWYTKRYARYQELIDLLSESFKLPIVLIGGPDDVPLCTDLANASAYPPINLSGKTDLLLSAAIIRLSSLVIANDSAPSHIAAAMGTPLVAIFGPTTPSFGFAPYSDNSIVAELADLYCRPCTQHGSEKCPQEHFRCMKDLSPEKIIEAIWSLPGAK